jgi:hypothetical protein
MKIKRICHNYSKWEDWKADMYLIKTIRPIMIQKSTRLLSDSKTFYQILNKLIKSWPFSTEHNLTDPSINKRAWLGRAACCFSHGANINETRIAWHNMESNLQDRANHIANRIISEWTKCKTRTSQCQRLIWE